MREKSDEKQSLSPLVRRGGQRVGHPRSQRRTVWPRAFVSLTLGFVLRAPPLGSGHIEGIDLCAGQAPHFNKSSS